MEKPRRPKESESDSGRFEARLTRQEIAITRSAPLPTPEELAAYERVAPGAAERILAMAEAQTRHRRELESAVVLNNISSERRAQWLAFCLALVVSGNGTYLIAVEQSAEGLVALVGTLAGLLALFLRGAHMRDRELESKQRKS
jgi:uncharacterized membrane protein